MVVVNATDNNDLTRHLRAFLASHWGIHGGGSAIGVRVGDLQDLLNEMSIIVHARNPREGEREKDSESSQRTRYRAWKPMIISE
jgi:hypothetical protein